MSKERPRVLIEDWLPVAAIGAESQRERGASSALPPLYFLHVWWARRPLTASRAAVLASLLPTYSNKWPNDLMSKFPNEKDYHKWFLRLIGILGDPVAGRKLINYARDKGVKIPGDLYGYKRAFTNNPDNNDLNIMQKLIEMTWGEGNLSVLDPMAGGGSIPFEALRYGYSTWANELNPVASVIIKATLEYPAKFGKNLVKHFTEWGNKIDEIASAQLMRFFPMKKGEKVRRYIWSRTVNCPATGKPIPLSPNWWLQKGSNPIAVKLLAKSEWDSCRFEIVYGPKAIKSNPDQGTINRGTAISPWTGDTIDSDYIKAEAQAGRMGQQLYALSTETKNGHEFRTPTEDDLNAINAAEKELSAKLPKWEARGLIPRESFPEVSTDHRPLLYGMSNWGEFFAPRQLLTLGIYLEVFHNIIKKAHKKIPDEMANAVQTYLGIALNKALDRNSRQCIWIPQRGVVSHSFPRHDFSFKWSHAEMTLPQDGFRWALSQVAESYSGIAELAACSQLDLFKKSNGGATDRLRITQGNAQNLKSIKNETIHLICVDPPYYDNVMYAELSDFYYVWMKRTLGQIYPDFFIDELTDKDNEAVANVARFEGVGRKNKRELAEKDYERKMAACFKEMNRVLHQKGILTVMFTHKKIEAWDTLAMALIGAGFIIKASWPIHTEYEKGLHQNKRNAASSTILLVCRKRVDKGLEVWWDDIKGKVREVAREKAAEFHGSGIAGVDLYLSTFGPVLSVISEKWPVLTSDVDEKTGKPKSLSLRPH